MIMCRKIKSGKWSEKGRGGKEGGGRANIDRGTGKEKEKIQFILWYEVIDFWIISLDPPIPKPEEKYDLEMKKENELVRRWKVHIF